MKYIGIIPADRLPSSSIGLRALEFSRMKFSRIVAYTSARATIAKQYAGVEIAKTPNELRDILVSEPGDSVVYFNGYSKIDDDVMKVFGAPSKNEIRCISGQLFAGSTPLGDKHLLKVMEYDRRRNVSRYTKGDSGDIVIDVADMRGPVVMDLDCLRSMLSFGDEWTRTIGGFQDAVDVLGVSVLCMDPIKHGVRWHPGLIASEKKPTSIVMRGSFGRGRRRNEMVAEAPSNRSGGRIIVAMASYPPRESGMLSVVRSLHGQCDKMFVALNGYSEENVERIRRIAGFDNVEFIGYTGRDDLGCQNKFRAIDKCGPSDYLLTVDDDIVYPVDYVKNLVRRIDENGHDKIVSFHGKNVVEIPFGLKIVGYMYYDALARDTPAMAVGCGVCGCVPSKIGLSFSVFDKEKNTGDDLLMMKWAEETGVKMVVASHRAGWLRHNIAVERVNPLYRNNAVTKQMKFAILESAIYRMSGRRTEPEIAETSDCGCIELVYISDEQSIAPLAASLQSVAESVEKYGRTAHVTLLFSGRRQVFDGIADGLSTDRMPVSVVELDKATIDKCNAYGSRTLSMKKASATTTALTKFDLPRILPGLRSVLYIDCDTIVCGDIGEFFEYGKTKVVSDIGAITLSNVPEWKLPRKEKSYFNSGVMLLDLDWMRANGIPEKLWGEKATINDQTLMDQNALNAVLKAAHHDSPRYNLLITSLAGLEKRYGSSFMEKINWLYGTNYDSVADGANSMFDDAVILHYAGRQKPWGAELRYSRERPFALWRKMYDKAKEKLVGSV